MTLDYLIKEYIESKYKKIKDKKQKECIEKNIYKKFSGFFVALNIDTILFKENEHKNSAWNFPNSCKEDLLTLIEYIDKEEDSIKNIKKNNIKYTDLNILKFCIDTVIRVLKELNYSESKVDDVSRSMISFTNYQLVKLKKVGTELISDFHYMHENDDDNLDISEHILFEEYAESEIRKLQEKLRYVYYVMNSEKSMQSMKMASKIVKNVDENGDLTDYLEKKKMVNKYLVEEFGQAEILSPKNKELIIKKRDEIELKLFGEKIERHKYVKYISDKLNLEKCIAQSDEYQSILKKEDMIINNNKMNIKTKIKNLAEQKIEEENIKQEITHNLFGENLVYDIEINQEETNTYQLLKNGINTANMLVEARNIDNKDCWPIIISQCEKFFKD
ncbi:MAG: hypothetical protein RSC24_16800 [Clostridium sp.]